jgi:hypothetical protein
MTKRNKWIITGLLALIWPPLLYVAVGYKAMMAAVLLVAFVSTVGWGAFILGGV